MEAKKGSTAPQIAMMYPWQTFPYQPGNMSPAITPLPVMPSSLAKHPQMWSKEEVGVWLKWCVEEYSISQIPNDKFNMNGKALCLLVRSDFMERVPDVGDILYNVLQKLINRNSGPMLYQPLPTYPAITSGNTGYSPCSVPATPRPDNTFLVVPGNTSSRPRIPQPRSNYIPILPDLKKALHSRESNPKYPLSVAAYRLPVSSPPDTVLSPAPSAGSDSGQSDHRSENASPPAGIEGGSDIYLETRKASMFADSGMETDQARTTPNSGYQRNVADVNQVWPEKNTDSKTRGTGCDLFCGDLGTLGFSSNFNYRHTNARTGDCRLLWEFINYLLVHERYTDYIRWEDAEKLTFRIINPTALAELWGIQKNRTNMTYEKLSRALRYYYKMNIIKKVPGKRLTYQFLQQPKDIKKGQRGARPQVRPPTTQYPYPGRMSEVSAKDHTLTDETTYNHKRMYLERPFNEEPELNDERSFKCDSSPFGEKPAFSASPSPPSLSSERSSIDSVSYNGTAEVVTFPVQDEPEDLSVKVLLQDKITIKREAVVMQHDVNLNFKKALNEYNDVLSPVASTKDEQVNGENAEMEAKS
ncbi:transcription factor ETV6-like isoform X2 [Liolophura sinensis]|uniref:transcription factor ETV6-like isoform X2 n=1 Tax=Liolophura sinensis TaxID=3198878 RepID=UPI00315952DE